MKDYNINKKIGFLLYPDQGEIVNSLTDKQAGKLFKGIYDFVNGKEPKLDPVLLLVFIPIRQSIERSKRNYKKVCEINRVNAKTRWSEAKKDTVAYGRMRSHARAYKNKNNNKNNNKEKEINKEKENVEKVWRHYQNYNPTNESLLPARRNKIITRLRAYPIETILQAITNCYSDDFWQKQNIDFLIKNDANIERMANLKVRPIVKEGQTVEEFKRDMKQQEVQHGDN